MTESQSEEKIIVPKNLYLVKNIEYGIYAQNIVLDKEYYMESVTLEIPLPSRTERFSNYGKIESPISGRFLTKIVGKYKADNASCFYKDIYLNVKDIASVTKKEVKILYVGDSIVNGNLPATLKHWLAEFGIQATMLGASSNSCDYGYGIQPPFKPEMGEGKGGWRLTDFTNKTKYPESAKETICSPFWNSKTHKVDFKHYLEQYNVEVPDFIILAVGTNDINGYHNMGGISETIEDLLNTTIERDIKALIDAFTSVNPNVKIGLNPPMTNGLDPSFSKKSNLWANKVQQIFDNNADYPNVFCLSSYLSSAWLSAPHWNTACENGAGGKDIINDVHQNGMAQLQNTLWVASWIVNCL